PFTAPFLVEPTAISLPDMAPVANVETGKIVISYQDFRNADGIGSFAIFRSQVIAGVVQTAVELATLNPEVQAGANYEDTTVVEDLQYLYFIREFALNQNYITRHS